MKDFKSQASVYINSLPAYKDLTCNSIDTPGVIQRVSTLFNGHPALIQGFNTFLPPGYRIECGTEDNPDAIRVTTPSGTNTLSMPRARPSMDSTNEIGPSSGLAPPVRPDYYDHTRSTWQQAQPPQQHPQQQQPQQPQQPHQHQVQQLQQQQRQHHQPGTISTPYSPPGRMIGSGLYAPQGGSSQPQDHHYDYQNQQDQQSSAGTVTIAHQQDQRGVSQLQSAVSAAAAGAGRPPIIQASSGTGASGVTQPMNSLAGLGSGVLQGSQAELNKRGPVEFNHAISYVNKIKVSEMMWHPFPC
jgi:paired amphipathic helix protein Sin3a